jgi:hypothetical protein
MQVWWHSATALAHAPGYVWWMQACAWWMRDWGCLEWVPASFAPACAKLTYLHQGGVTQGYFRAESFCHVIERQYTQLAGHMISVGAARRQQDKQGSQGAAAASWGHLQNQGVGFRAWVANSFHPSVKGINWPRVCCW